jgi:hypothetical protein
MTATAKRAQSGHSLKPKQIAAFRLGRHHLLDRQPAELTTVTSDVCGIQAQLMSSAEIALSARIPDLTRAEIHSVLWERRTLVKTSCMRGTLHLLSASDFPIYMAAFRSSRVRESLRIMARYGVTEKEAYAVMESALGALSRGPFPRRPLTEHVLSEVKLSKKAKLWFEQSWWGVARQAIVEGLVCYGPDQGQEVSVIRVDQWLTKNKACSESDARKLLLRHYLRAYGPATPQDFCKWSGFPIPEVRLIWKSLREELSGISADGEPAAILYKDQGELSAAAVDGDTVHLLPSFDPYMLAHATKDHIVAPSRYKQVYKNAAWLAPVILLNGKVVSVWSYNRRGRRLMLEITTFENLAKPIRSLIEERAAGVARFLDLPWNLKFCG